MKTRMTEFALGLGLVTAAAAWAEAPTRQRVDGVDGNARTNARTNARQINARQRPMNPWNNAQVELQSALPAREASGPLTARRIARTIEDAVLFLKRQQAEDGSIGEDSYARGGSTALATLALLASGASPASDLQLRRALEWLAALDADNTYVRGIRANVWEYALRKVPDPRYRAALEADAAWLVEALGDDEGWRYQMDSPDWDNSCTQYGVLGLWAAARAGVDPGRRIWDRMSAHFRKVQSEDGGFGYQVGGSSANMATAGLASLFLVFDMQNGRRFYTRKDPQTFQEGESAQVLGAIERGMEWLGKNEGGMSDGYFLYGIERTGVASGRKFIGGRDWFREGATTVLGQQRADGAIPNSYSPVIGTAFSTLFLVYGGAPVALNKLQYGTDQDWNLNPRDLAQVSAHLWSAYERPLNWHTVALDAEVEEFEAPILFISGTHALSFSDVEVTRLRDYIQRGGTVLAEPSDHAPEFSASLAPLVARLFPAQDYPNRLLRPLAASHPLFRAAGHTWSSPPPVRAVTDGSRLLFLVSDGDLSGRWQAGDKSHEAFDFALSLLFHVTEQRPLLGKFATDLPESPAAPATDTVLKVARFCADGTPDADLAARSWARFSEYLTQVTGVKTKDLGDVPLTPFGLQGVDLLHLTGREGFSLEPAERAALFAFVDAGGTLLTDAWGGSRAFGTAARQELEGLFGALSPLPDEDPVAVGNFEGGTDLSRDVRLTLPARRQRLTEGLGAGHRGQQLWIARREGRPAVFFSDLDLSAALAGVGVPGALGYAPDSARRIVANVAGFKAASTAL